MRRGCEPRGRGLGWFRFEQGDLLGHCKFTFPENETNAGLWSCDRWLVYSCCLLGTEGTTASRSAGAPSSPHPPEV